jgi:hypothetical protein
MRSVTSIQSYLVIAIDIEEVLFEECASGTFSSHLGVFNHVHVWLGVDDVGFIPRFFYLSRARHKAIVDGICYLEVLSLWFLFHFSCFFYLLSPAPKTIAHAIILIWKCRTNMPDCLLHLITANNVPVPMRT